MDYNIQLKTTKTKIYISSFQILLQIMVATGGFELSKNIFYMVASVVVETTLKDYDSSVLPLN